MLDRDVADTKYGYPAVTERAFNLDCGQESLPPAF